MFLTELSKTSTRTSTLMTYPLIPKDSLVQNWRKVKFQTVSFGNTTQTNWTPVKYSQILTPINTLHIYHPDGLSIDFCKEGQGLRPFSGGQMDN